MSSTSASDTRSLIPCRRAKSSSCNKSGVEARNCRHSSRENEIKGLKRFALETRSCPMIRLRYVPLTMLKPGQRAGLVQSIHALIVKQKGDIRRYLHLGEKLVLCGYQTVVIASMRHELRMCPTFDDPAPVKHQNLMGIANRREPVRDDKRRPPFQQYVKPFLNQVFGIGINTRRRLIEYQDARISKNGSRKRNELALSLRQAAAALAHLRVITFWQVLDKLMRIDGTCSRLHLFVGSSRIAVPDIVHNGSRKDK